MFYWNLLGDGNVLLQLKKAKIVGDADLLIWCWLRIRLALIAKGPNDEQPTSAVVLSIYTEIKNSFLVILLMFPLTNLVFVQSNNSVIVIDI